MLFLIRKNFACLVIVTATLIVILSAYTYNAISSKLIFKESATHLNEIYSQVGNSLSNLLSENWNAMDMWLPYLEDTDDDKKIRTYIENIRRIGAFTDFYFLDKDGSYCTVDGNTGRMDLGRNMRILMEEGKKRSIRYRSYRQVGAYRVRCSLPRKQVRRLFVFRYSNQL